MFQTGSIKKTIIRAEKKDVRSKPNSIMQVNKRLDKLRLERFFLLFKGNWGQNIKRVTNNEFIRNNYLYSTSSFLFFALNYFYIYLLSLKKGLIKSELSQIDWWDDEKVNMRVNKKQQQQQSINCNNISEKKQFYNTALKQKKKKIK